MGRKRPVRRSFGRRGAGGGSAGSGASRATGDPRHADRRPLCRGHSPDTWLRTANAGGASAAISTPAQLPPGARVRRERSGSGPVRCGTDGQDPRFWEKILPEAARMGGTRPAPTRGETGGPVAVPATGRTRLTPPPPGIGRRTGSRTRRAPGTRMTAAGSTSAPPSAASGRSAFPPLSRSGNAPASAPPAAPCCSGSRSRSSCRSPAGSASRTRRTG